MCRPRPEYGQLVLCLLVALGDTLGQLHLFLGGQELHLADLLQVHPHGIVQAVFGSQVHRVDELFFFNISQVQPIVQVVPQAVPQTIQGVVDIQLRGHDLDVHGLEPVVDLFDFFRRELHFLKDGAQLRVLDHALFFTLQDQGLHGGLQILAALGGLLHCTHSFSLFVIWLSNFFA